MKKLIFSLLLLCGASTIFPASAPTAARWLIFGANAGNKDQLDHIFKGSGIEWVGFDSHCDNTPNCITGDFNKIEDLNKLRDNYYDVIYFDGSTVKFLDWTKDHLKTVAKKLKNPGLLLVPKENQMKVILDHDPAAKPLATPLDYLTKIMGTDKAYNFNLFNNGQNGPIVIARKPEFQKVVGQFNALITKKALTALEGAYNKKAKFYDDTNSKTYPPMSRGSFEPKPFYAALNTTADLNVDDAYLRLILNYLPRIKPHLPEPDFIISQ